MAKKKTEQEESLEKKLWKTADKLRKNIDAAEYKHVVLGLIFLKYISMLKNHEKLKAGKGNMLEPILKIKMSMEQKMYSLFPKKLVTIHTITGKLPNIGKLIDDAMDLIEADNATLKGILQKVWSTKLGCSNAWWIN